MIGESHRYGMMREVEYDLIDDLMDTLKAEFGDVRFLEIGVCGGGTVRGVYRRAKEIGCPVHGAGVDWESQLPQPPPDPGYEPYAGDTMDMWREVKGRFNFLLVDGCHCINHSMTDFLNYSPFVDVGGYCLFHDTALPTGVPVQGEWPQNHSYAGVKDSVLGVRSGLEKTGLLQGYRSDWRLVRELEAEDGLMGMCLFQKLKELC